MSGFLRQYTALTFDWAVASWVSATLDYFFGLWATESHILNVFGGTLQLTIAFLATHEILLATGQRRANNTIQQTWIMGPAIVAMSPNCFCKLKAAYYSLHAFLYGKDSMPDSGCGCGKGCGGGDHGTLPPPPSPPGSGYTPPTDPVILDL